MTDLTPPLMEQLSSPQSAKRRTAAWKLRKLGDPVAGPALLAALEREVLDARTWETQYQMVMAVGECGYRNALPFLKDLANRSIEATMVYVALGDTIVRLSRTGPSDALPILKILRAGRQPMLLDGAFRAMAMLRMVPSSHEVTEIVAYAASLPPSDGLRFWVAAAAPGWRSPEVAAFLQACVESERSDLKEAASLAIAGKYKTWRPL